MHATFPVPFKRMNVDIRMRKGRLPRLENSQFRAQNWLEGTEMRQRSSRDEKKDFGAETFQITIRQKRPMWLKTGPRISADIQGPIFCFGSNHSSCKTARRSSVKIFETMPIFFSAFSQKIKVVVRPFWFLYRELDGEKRAAKKCVKWAEK